MICLPGRRENTIKHVAAPVDQAVWAAAAPSDMLERFRALAKPWTPLDPSNLPSGLRRRWVVAARRDKSQTSAIDEAIKEALMGGEAQTNEDEAAISTCQDDGDPAPEGTKAREVPGIPYPTSDPEEGAVAWTVVADRETLQAGPADHSGLQSGCSPTGAEGPAIATGGSSSCPGQTGSTAHASSWYPEGDRTGSQGAGTEADRLADLSGLQGDEWDLLKGGGSFYQQIAESSVRRDGISGRANDTISDRSPGSEIEEATAATSIPSVDKESVELQGCELFSPGDLTDSYSMTFDTSSLEPSDSPGLDQMSSVAPDRVACNASPVSLPAGDPAVNTPAADVLPDITPPPQRRNLLPSLSHNANSYALATVDASAQSKPDKHIDNGPIKARLTGVTEIPQPGTIAINPSSTSELPPVKPQSRKLLPQSSTSASLPKSEEEHQRLHAPRLLPSLDLHHSKGTGWMSRPLPDIRGVRPPPVIGLPDLMSRSTPEARLKFGSALPIPISFFGNADGVEEAKPVLHPRARVSTNLSITNKRMDG